MPSSLTTLLPLALGSSPHLPVSVCGTGALNIPLAFSRRQLQGLPYYIFSPLRPGTITRDPLCQRVSKLKFLAATEFLPYVHRLRLAASP